MAPRIAQPGNLSPGYSNRRALTKLATVTESGSRATYLSAAVNVDISSEGLLKRRKWRTQVLAGKAHSLWADAGECFAVVDGALVALSSAGGALTKQEIRTGVRGRVSYARGGDGDVYWTDGSVLRRIHAGQDCAVGREPPPAPAVEAIGGTMLAGRYLLALTVVGQDGESPSSPVVQVELAAAGGLRISGVGREAQLYLSGPNGSVLQHVSVLPPEGMDLVVPMEGGRRCPALNTALMPAGQIVRHFAGRMLVAKGGVLYISQPFNYGINPFDAYLSFAGEITVVEPLDDGLFIVADKTYWIADLDAGELRELLPLGAVKGTSGRIPRQQSVFWHSPRGLVMGSPGGVVKTPQDAAVKFGPAREGASLYREDGQITQIVTSRSSRDSLSQTGAGGYMTARVVKE